jgi:hypothetical protein
MTLAEKEIVGKVFRNLATIRDKEEFLKFVGAIKDKMDDLAHAYAQDDLPLDRDEYLIYQDCYSLLSNLATLYD